MSVVRVEIGAGNIAHIVFDDPQRKLNVLDEASIADLDAALATIEKIQDVQGVVVRSGKPGSFIAGADVDAIGAMTDRERVLVLVRRAHAVFERLAALPVPTVAAIDGVCLGGGTELALACDSRVASEEPHTQIGLPEVMLGIIPGFGGTTRLPRVTGVSTALDLILTGRALDSRRAEKAGLIARAVPAAWLVEAAEKRAFELALRPAARRRDTFRPRTLMARLIDGTPFGRAIAFSRARAMTRAKTGGEYPAPIAAITVMQSGFGQPVARGLELEAPWVADLVTGRVCKNLVRIFRLSEHAKKAQVAADPQVAARPVRHMGLIGAGVMGGGIAELASRNGVGVRMRDLTPEAVTRALQTTRGLIDDRLRKRLRGAARGRERDAQMARILPTLDLSGFANADFVMEAVIEDLDIKRRVFGELEVRMREDAVLATNTSSLSVNALAEGLKHPGRFCGFHFFNPVHRMPLVEVVRGARTSDTTLATAVGLARRMGKTPVVVEDAPGFVVNRILMPYLREAMHLLEEGHALKDIDAAMRRFGMPMGPFEVVDEVGIDVAARVAGILSRAFPDRMTPSKALEKLAAAGRLGRKSGAGFYRHKGGRRVPDPGVRGLLELGHERGGAHHDALAERMTLAMINEAARCLEAQVAKDAGSIDLAMIFGAGFPPFRGGPLRHADTLGLKTVTSRLTALRAENGERFAPCALLERLAREGSTFTQPLV